jgi:Ca2+-binding RTX toxin-like protein
MRKVFIFLVVLGLGAIMLPAQASTVYCFGRAATIKGTNGNDTLRGTSGPDVIAGLAGADTVYGGGDNDFICGMKGGDRLYGDHTSATNTASFSGDDALSGGKGNDRLYGDDNRNVDGNTLFGNAGNDYLDAGTLQSTGGSRRNIVAYNDAPGPISVTVTGFRTATVAGLDGTDTLVHLGVISGSTYDDEYNIPEGTFLDGISGAGGNDTFFLYGSVNADLAGDDGCHDIYCLTSPGTPGNDVFNLGSNASTGEYGLFGQEGNDVINGSSASESLGFFGSDPGADTINGRDGNDAIDVTDGVSGNDTANGGAGSDSCAADVGDVRTDCEG